MRAAMLEGCVQRVFFGRVNRAAAAVLAADGCEVVVPAGQGCCGALALHAGREDEARRRAQDTIRALGGFERVVVTAAGCGSAMKEYGDLLDTDEARRFSASVRDVTELCAELGPAAERAPHAPVRVAYQDACHLRQAQGVAAQPRAMLAAIPGVELVEIEQPDMCCGSAGIYNLLEPATARELGCAQGAGGARRRAGHPRHREPRLRDPDRGGAAARGPSRPADRPPGRTGGAPGCSTRRSRARTRPRRGSRR